MPLNEEKLIGLLQQATEGIVEQLKGEPGDKPSEAEVLYYIQKVFDANRDDLKGERGEPGKDGENGKTPTEEYITSLLKGIFENRKAELKGERGYTPIKGVDYFDGSDGRDGKDGETGKMPDHQIESERIRFQKPDETWGEWIDFGKIISELVKKIKPRMSSRIFGGVATNAYVVEDLSDQCNGSNKVFTLQNAYKSGTITLTGSQIPRAYRPTAHFTESNNAEITLTSEVGAPQAGQTLICTYVRS